MTLRVHKFWHGRCPLLGPSLYVWVQGCPRRCEACFNQEALDEHAPAWAASPQALASVWQQRKGGVVLSGGEPFAQAKGLADFCRAVRAIDPDTPILVYTGYLMQQLLQADQADWLDLLRQADVLVDGPFVHSRLSDHPLTGSDNQRIYLLGKRISQARLEALQRAQIQVGLTLDGQMRLVGTGSAAWDMHTVVAALRQQGLTVGASDGR